MSLTPVVITSVLGSCVSVCLWDKKLKIGGMNHFLFPRSDGCDKLTSKYGNVATLVLIRMLVKEGSEVENLEAQIFGGGYPKKNAKENMGEENVNIARSILGRSRIPIVSEDVGGRLGRKIMFDTQTGHVAVLKVRNIRKSDWVHDFDG